MARVDGAGVGTLELLDLADHTTTVVATAAPTDFFAGPQWSPDGRSIVVEVVHRVGSGVYDEPTGDSLSVVDLDQEPPTISTITDAELFAGEADWSPDGEWIVYSGDGRRRPAAQGSVPDPAGRLGTAPTDDAGERRSVCRPA